MLPASSTYLKPTSNISFLSSILVAVVALGVWLLLWQQPSPKSIIHNDSLEHNNSESSPRTYEVSIRKPAGPPAVKTGVIDAHGQPVTVACHTCHTTKAPNSDLRLGNTLKSFHQGLIGKHSDLTCVSCHNSQEGYQSLRLADGKSLPFTEVMQLCAQCHGPQYRDYLHGAHGGMTGYWDLSKGPRQRNNCIDCHDPHAPKYPVVRPVPGPLDRIHLPSQSKQGASHE